MVIVETKLGEEIAKPCAAVTYSFPIANHPVSKKIVRERERDKRCSEKRENSSEISVSALQGNLQRI